MSRRCVSIAGIVLCTLFVAWSARAALPVRLSTVVSVTDLEAEVAAKVSEIDSALASNESYDTAKGKLPLAATQLAIVAQAIAEHDQSSKLKSSAPALRDAAVQLRQSTSLDWARTSLDAMRAAIEGKGPATASKEIDWAKLARNRALMDSLRERTDLIRKALRKPKDPVAESRHASVMAVLAVAIATHADEIKNPADRPLWNDWSMEVQREMTKTADAMRRQDTPTVIEHFKAAQAACDRCHETFKK